MGDSRIRVAGFLAVLLVSLVLARAAKGATFEEIKKRDAAKIASLEQTEKSIQKLKDEVVSFSEQYDKGFCTESFNKDDEGCKALAQATKRDNRKIRDLTKKAEKLRGQLTEYLESAETIIAVLRPAVSAGAGTQGLEEAIECLRSISDVAPSARALHSEAVKLLTAIDPNNGLKELRGFNDRDCKPPEIETECWEKTYGQLTYVTKGKFRLYSDCLIHNSGKDWSQFPPEPGALVAAIDEAYEGLKGCYSRINRSKAVDLANFISVNRPMVRCDPLPPDKDDHECAHAAKEAMGIPMITLTRPKNCGPLGPTVFHEALHAGGKAESLPTKFHNDPGSCKAYDAVYTCSEFCFPANPPQSWVTQAGCKSCTRGDGSLKPNSSIDCGQYPDKFDGCSLNMLED